MPADAIVVGAGPAGAVASLLLARAGVRVRLLDRAIFPRDKLCGDTVNPGACAILRRLGLDDVLAGGLPVSGMIVTGEGGIRVVGPYEHGCQGLAISRRVLDERLVEAAAAAGASVEEGVRVLAPALAADGQTVIGVDVISRSGRRARYGAAVTIAADGRNSRIARALHLVAAPAAPRRWAIGARFRGVSGLTAFGEMHVRGDRYIGVAPLPGGDANACVVTADRASLRSREFMTAALASEPATAGRFARAEMLAPPSMLGPLALDASAAGTPGLLLAGDAAGFIDPMTGDGLRFAFRGGELAAAEALRVLASGWQNAHVRLWQARRREFSAKWRFNRTLRSLAASPALVRAAGAGATLSPWLLRRVIAYAGDVALA